MKAKKKLGKRAYSWLVGPGIVCNEGEEIRRENGQKEMVCQNTGNKRLRWHEMKQDLAARHTKSG